MEAVNAPRLLLFAKPPERGQVKTRLARDLGEVVALEFHLARLADLAETLAASGLPFAVCHAPGPPTALDALRGLFGPQTPFILQQGADLGARMADAFERSFAGGWRAAVLFGSDVPQLSLAVLNQAAQSLAGREDAVLGPAEDGGYYLIGLTGRSFSRRLFQDLPWSRPELAALTLARFETLGVRPALLPTLRDVDEAPDLAALAAPDLGPRTAALLGRLVRSGALDRFASRAAS